jgi:hypothetical protein
LLGVGATRTLDRLAASLGELPGGARIAFAPALDIEHGGVLWSVPSLLAVGLLTPASQVFPVCEGFYPLSSLLLFLSFLALARIPTLEKIRYLAPAEWGKLLGLDRIPEVKTLRRKLKSLCHDGPLVAEWGAQLATAWMNTGEEQAGLFYIDGHLREYSGAHAHLPRHFSSRQRLCARGVVDYWVNAYGGDPFFVVSKELDPGLVSVLRDEIVPRLLREYHPPADAQGADRRPKFTMIFDRGGFSPQLFVALARQGIAVLTYKKFVKDEWPRSEFVRRQVQLVSGELVEMQLAERPLELPDNFIGREIRRLTASDHQTSVICTDPTLSVTSAAPYMFARWCQENFFKYMMKEFNIDHLCAYELVELPGTTQIINPAWKTLASRINAERQKLRREVGKLGALQLEDTALSARAVEKYQLKSGELRQSIEARQQQLATLKIAMHDIARYVSLAELPAEQRYHDISTGKKMFVDIIKMIAYRAETTMANILREHLARKDDVRALLQQLFKSSADVIPDYAQNTLTVLLHYPASHLHAAAFKRLAEELNATQTQYPGTELTMIYKVGP